MEPNDECDRLLDELEAALRRDEDVAFAILFGSQLADDSHSSSDVDLALKFADELSPTERFRKRCFLSGDLQRDDAPFVDVSDIETLPVDVARDAVDGTLLCGDERAFREFKADVEARFDERRDEIRRHQRDVIDRIAESGLHG